jgi:exopolysaccharide biosynthesis polyprenyl glycosylphosphotransferase
MRITALLVADIGAFLLLRTTLRFLRDWSASKGVEAEFVHWLFAKGYLGGWQYAAALILSLAVTRNYGPGDNRRTASRLLAACALATALPLWAGLWSQPILLTISRYFLTATPTFLVLLGVRLLFDHLVSRFAPSPHGAAVARTILVGHAGECIDMKGRKALTEGNGFHVVGYVDLQTPPARGALGSLDDLERILIAHRVDTLVLCGPADDSSVVRLMRAAMATECQVLTAARRFELAGVKPAIVWRHGQPFIELRQVALRAQQIFLKRMMDILLSSVALVLLSPVMLLVAVAVWLESPGPVFFRQMRPGRGGRRFGMLKFRSMYRDAEAVLKTDPALYEIFLANSCKLPAELDPRITRVGRFLRRTSLDELPQLWNVLMGEMSLVGPRPVVGPELEEYGDAAPILLSVRPGITGLWQVSGRSTLQYPERAIMDIEYVEHWSLSRDLRIMARTVPAVLGARGAH